MMFLHLVRSFGSKTVKLPHVLTFFWRADLCAACSFRTALQKMHCKKMHEVRVEQKRAQETKTMLVARWEDDLAHCSLYRQRRAERKFDTRMRCMSEVFTKQVACGSIPTTKETSVRHKFALFNVPVANIPRHDSNNLHRHGHTSTHVQAMLDWEESESSSGCALASRVPGKQEFQD